MWLSREMHVAKVKLANLENKNGQSCVKPLLNKIFASRVLANYLHIVVSFITSDCLKFFSIFPFKIMWNSVTTGIVEDHSSSE